MKKKIELGNRQRKILSLSNSAQHSHGVLKDQIQFSVRQLGSTYLISRDKASNAKLESQPHGNRVMGPEPQPWNPMDPLESMTEIEQPVAMDILSGA